MAKLVKAIRAGFYNGERKREGAVFEVGDKVKAGWFEPVAAEKKEIKVKVKKEAETFSEITKEITSSNQEVI